MVHRSAVFPQVWGIAAEVGEKQRNSNAGFSAFNLLLHSCWVAEIAPGLITACVGDLILFFFAIPFLPCPNVFKVFLGRNPSTSKTILCICVL